MTRALVLVAALLAGLGFGPFDTRAAPVTREARGEPAVRHRDGLPPAHFFWLSFRFYQTVVSPMDGPRCSHHPTCSAFALEAVRRRGTLIGLLLTVDRLTMTNRSSALRRFPLVEIGGELRIDHPVPTGEEPGP